jgi:hypothetical protein
MHRIATLDRILITHAMYKVQTIEFQPEARKINNHRLQTQLNNITLIHS